ncbi:phosphatase PAP2 family protein [Methylobacterium sp.]|uniref:phosphatase PAP2 family protein n=1 Tax=Methylobacterium sp. TaxID=409 RepID=UPI002624D07D|nr:phosphatase PAP2 family protein [Methylobacterium sp.]MDB5644815.1 phosphatase family protein [Methylobacterium sp.]
MTDGVSGLARRLEAGDVRLGVSLARAKDTRRVQALAAASEAGGWRWLLALSTGTLAYGLLRRNPRLAEAGRHMLASGVLAAATKTTVKRIVHRTRPNVLMDEGFYEKGWFGPNVGPWQSFPSGHSAMSVAVASAAGRAYPEIRGVATAAALGVVGAQVLRGAHFPSDVVAGALIGLTSEAVAHELAIGRDRIAACAARTGEAGR